uniref:Uncharacterized protein n=1 Tax=Arundo donax TaxID=35708 RepID=A0A0A8ZE49_ARUDO
MRWSTFMYGYLLNAGSRLTAATWAHVATENSCKKEYERKNSVC